MLLVAPSTNQNARLSQRDVRSIPIGRRFILLLLTMTLENLISNVEILTQVEFLKIFLSLKGLE